MMWLLIVAYGYLVFGSILLGILVLVLTEGVSLWLRFP